MREPDRRARQTAVLRANSGFEIDREGVWHHDGSPIKREAMVRLFAQMLHRDDSGYFLRTPDQMLRIVVRDAPFVVVDCEPAGGDDPAGFLMVLNTGERFLLGKTHPLLIREDPERGETRVYLSARDGMPALVHRNVFYRLAEYAVHDPDSGRQGIRSGGMFFPLH